MPWILFFNAIDEVLEIIAIPLSSQTFHDFYPAVGLAFFVLRQLIEAAFPLTEKVGTDEVQVLIVNVNLSSG